MTGSEQFAHYAQHDPNHLRLLAALLAFPTTESLAALHDIAPSATWLMPAVNELSALPLTQWQGEHTRLFIAGYPKTPCAPFLSIYGHSSAHPNVVANLHALYRRAGLQVDPAVAADYGGVLLECAAYLTDVLHAPASSDTAAAGSLLSELWTVYLQPWLPSFAHDLQQHAQLQLYYLLGVQLARLVPMGTIHPHTVI